MPEHSGLIIIDFDHTILQTTLFTDALKHKFSEFGVSALQFKNAYENIKNCCQVDMDKFTAALSPGDNQRVHDAMHEIIQTSMASWIYQDAKQFLLRYKTTHDIIVLTQGDKALQQEKIDHSHLPSGLKIIITEDSKAGAVDEFMHDYKTIHYIDDKPRHIDEIKEAYPKVITMFMTRPEDSPYADEGVKHADYTIINLKIKLKDFTL